MSPVNLFSELTQAPCPPEAAAALASDAADPEYGPHTGRGAPVFWLALAVWSALLLCGGVGIGWWLYRWIYPW